AEPIGKNAVFGDAVQDAIGTDDRGIDSSRKNQRTHHDDENVKNQTHREGTGKTHGQAADQIFEKLGPGLVRDDHHRKEGNQRSEDHAVDKNDQSGLLKIGKLGVFDFAIYLGQGFLAAHGQDGMAQADEHGRESDQVWNPGAKEPSQRMLIENDIAR